MIGRTIRGWSLLTGGPGPRSAAATYADKVIGYGPIAYWRLNETTGTAVTDSSGNGCNGTYTGVTLNNSTFLDGDPVPFWDGSNDYADVYSATLAGLFDGNEGSLGVWFKVNSADVWGTSNFRFATAFRQQSNLNPMQIIKANTTNRLDFYTGAGGTLETVQHAMSSADWTFAMVTWSSTADEMKAYINGSQTGTTQTGLGTYSGTIGQDFSSIGIYRKDQPTLYVWHGWLAHVMLFDAALSSTDIADLATV